MKCTILTAAVISLLLGIVDLTVAQTEESDRALVHVRAIASLTLARNWLDWRQDGPENGGICLLGSVERDSTGVQITTIKSAARVARLSGCLHERAIGAAIFAPSELFDHEQLEELACAAVRGRDEWVVFGIITGAEAKLLESGEVMTVARGLWCTVVHEGEPPLLAGLP
ncbi:MAG: hypothetical protein JSV86_08055 [Gemmatimonadota bacterium]|nr:MAG: hypothetical protein JSV86_08055 [Gemmatimonadota bacterium]